MMPDFHVFYCRHRTGDCIESHRPVPVDSSQLADLASAVLEESGDFLGLVDEDDSVLQFIYVARAEDDRQPIRMEIPDVAEKGNLIRYISNAELFELLRNLPDKLTKDIISAAGSKPKSP